MKDIHDFSSQPFFLDGSFPYQKGICKSEAISCPNPAYAVRFILRVGKTGIINLSCTAGPHENQGIAPDEEAAVVVKRIFSLCAEGKVPNQIARILTKEKVLNPTNYYYQKHGASHRNLDTTTPFRS
ncbi:MAG TPA: hypothetical protein DCZ10_06375 [Pelotomaculum sp.]|nr:hypothetical protein [Pelotomaculum sp.]